MKHLYILLLVLMGISVATGQTFDAAFGNQGKVITSVNQEATMLKTVVQQDDRVVGLISLPPSVNGNLALVRYNPDGTIDTTYGTDGFVYTTLVDEPGFQDKLIALPDDTILVGGVVLSDSQDFRFAVAKFNVDGIPDDSFGEAGLAVANLSTLSEFVYSIDVDSDGRIVGAGAVPSSSGGYEYVAVTRFLQNGAVDSTFGTAGSIILDIIQNSWEGATTVKTLDSGKILVVGHSMGNNGNVAILVMRLNPDGTPDNSFGNGGRQTHSFAYSHSILSSTIAENGSIFVTGYIPDTTLGGIIVKLTPDGNLDTTFGDDGKIIPTGYGGIANLLQVGGALYCGGIIVEGGSSMFQIRAYNLEGDVISDFGNDGVFSFGMSETSMEFGGILTRQADGKILICGDTGLANRDCALARLELESLSTHQPLVTPISVHPNPFVDSVTINVSNTFSSEPILTLIDTSGKVIAQNLPVVQSQSQSVTVNLPPGLSKGLYFLNVMKGKNRSVVKIVKQ